jgi:hypothetical protein
MSIEVVFLHGTYATTEISMEERGQQMSCCPEKLSKEGRNSLHWEA